MIYTIISRLCCRSITCQLSHYSMSSSFWDPSPALEHCQFCGTEKKNEVEPCDSSQSYSEMVHFTSIHISSDQEGKHNTGTGQGWGGRAQHSSGHKTLKRKQAQYYLYFISLSLNVHTGKWHYCGQCCHFLHRFIIRLKEYTIYKMSLKSSEHSVSRKYYHLTVIVVLPMPGRLHDIYITLFFILLSNILLQEERVYETLFMRLCL